MQERFFDPIEEEINTIRLRIYDRIKNMTPEEEARYFITRTDPIIKKYNMKMSPLRPVKPIKREDRLTEPLEDSGPYR